MKYKLVVFVPLESEEKVRLAMGAAGAGKIGKYDYCAFVSRGTGYYRPLDGAQPYKGETGKSESADEYRVEVVVEEKLLGNVITAMKAAHPYDEVAYDVYELVEK